MEPTLHSRESEIRLIDATGRFCPVPILELAKAARGMAPGAELQLLATDPAIAQDLPAWCEATGHRLVSLELDGKCYRARIRLA